MKKIFLLLTIPILINSCVSYKVKNLNENIEKIEYENIQFIENTDSFSSKKIVGDINITDFKKEWSEIKPNIIKTARENYANAIVLETFELVGKIVKGTLYQVNALELQSLKNIEKPRKLYIFRDELGSVLTAQFKTELTINDNTEKLKDKSLKVTDLDTNQSSINIAINGKEKILKLTKGSNYFWISRNINASQLGGTGLGITLGGQKILRIDDTEMARIWVSTME